MHLILFSTRKINGLRGSDVERKSCLTQGGSDRVVPIAVGRCWSENVLGCDRDAESK